MAAREGLRGLGSSASRPAEETGTERLAKAPKAASSSRIDHAREGVRQGSEEAAEVLRREGFSEGEIQRLRESGELERTAEIVATTAVEFRGVGTITPREWAIAKRSHDHRKVESQHADEGKRAPKVDIVEVWSENPDELDFPGVDTVEPIGNWLSDPERAEFSEVTNDLWPWQNGGEKL